MLNSGDITEVDLGTPIGSEAGLRRPAVVVTATGVLRGGPTVVQVVPLTRTIRSSGAEVYIEPDDENHLSAPPAAQRQHVRSVSVARLGATTGTGAQPFSQRSARFSGCCSTSDRHDLSRLIRPTLLHAERELDHLPKPLSLTGAGLSDPARMKRVSGRERMVARYTSLGWGKLTSAMVFTASASLLAWQRPARDVVPCGLAAALTPLVLVLVQAGVYWLLARRWVLRSPMPSSLAGLYHAFRVLDPFVLAAGLVGVVVWFPHTWGWRLALMGIWAFGAIEYLNYYVVRLSYPVRRWFSEIGRWRTPRLIADLRAASTGRSSADRRTGEPSPTARHG